MSKPRVWWAVKLHPGRAGHKWCSLASVLQFRTLISGLEEGIEGTCKQSADDTRLGGSFDLLEARKLCRGIWTEGTGFMV